MFLSRQWTVGSWSSWDPFLQLLQVLGCHDPWVFIGSGRERSSLIYDIKIDYLNCDFYVMYYFSISRVSSKRVITNSLEWLYQKMMTTFYQWLCFSYFWLENVLNTYLSMINWEDHCSENAFSSGTCFTEMTDMRFSIISKWFLFFLVAFDQIFP